MARAPQNVTRKVALATFAPPARAPMAPSKARKISEAIETPATRNERGISRTIASGIAAQIGRASCRERVCKYVWMSVGEGALEKKQKAKKYRWVTSEKIITDKRK